MYLADPLVVLPASTNAAGFATLNSAIPVDLALPREMYGQALVVDPANGCGGLSFTLAWRLTFGI